MKPLASSEIVGSWATLLLPIDDDESIDFARLADEIDTLVAFRPDGIYSMGTAGEFCAVTEPEFDAISEMLAQKCEAAHVPFQIGASHPSPHISLERIRRAAAMRPGAIQVILADWFPLSNVEAIRCLSRFAEAAGDIGLVLYNPPHAKRVLTPENLGELKRAVPSFVGIKVMDGDDAWYDAIRRHAEGLSIFVPGLRLASGYVRGAHGAYSNMACLHPLAAQRWYRLMTTDPNEALRIERQISDFFTSHITPLITQRQFSNAAVDKLLAAIGDWADIGTRLRWPYRSLSASEADQLRPIAHTMMAGFFSLALPECRTTDITRTQPENSLR